MGEVLDSASGMISIGVRNNSKWRYADDIDIVPRSETKLATLLQILYSVSRKNGMKINAKKIKVMTISKNSFQNRLTVDGSELESVCHFKYLGTISSEAASKPEILARTAQAAAVMSCLRLVLKNRRISIRTRLKLVQTMVESIFLYVCETWTLTAELQQKIQAAEICWLQTILGISYIDHVSNKI